jgi:hypothetical protein
MSDLGEVYKPGFCWHGIQGQNKINKPCNKEARKYLVKREASGLVSTMFCFMWLCPYHVETMSRGNRYTLTQVNVKA